MNAWRVEVIDSQTGGEQLSRANEKPVLPAHGAALHGLAVLLVVLAASSLRAEVSTYPGSAGIAPSMHYRVEVAQHGRTQPSFVYSTQAQWRSNRSKDTSWTAFSFAGRVTVTVTKLRGAFSRCRVLPSSRGIQPRVQGNTAVFDLDRPAKLAVEFDESIEHPLLVFADPPENNIPERGQPDVIWFGPGVHDLGEGLTARAGQTVYLAGGAFVKGRIRGTNASGAAIRGRGVLSGEHLPQGGDHLLQLGGWQTRGALVEDVTLVGSPHYNIVLDGQSNVVRNVKMLSWWFSTDGVGIGSQGLVEDCFFKVNDDALKLYHSGMRVRDCVFWQMENGAPFQISWNMPGDNHGFRVSNCDVIRVEHQWNNPNEAVFDSIHGGSGHMRDYVFENIRIENCAWRLFHLAIATNEFAKATTRGRISNLTFRNVSVDGPLKMPSLIMGWDAEHRIEDITMENLRIGGKLITNAAAGNFEIDPATTRNIRFAVPRSKP